MAIKASGKNRSNNHRQLVGQRGEEAVCWWLKKNHFEIVEQNWFCRAGEIDIIARKDNIYHFVEIKSCCGEKRYWPEESLTAYKQYRIINTILKYVDQKGLNDDWQLDVALVTLNQSTGRVRIELLANHEIDEQVINSF